MLSHLSTAKAHCGKYAMLDAVADSAISDCTGEILVDMADDFANALMDFRRLLGIISVLSQG